MTRYASETTSETPRRRAIPEALDARLTPSGLPSGPMDAPRRPATFIVRISRDATGEIIGSVQRVRTGERRPFHRAEAIGALIVEMIATGGPEDAESGVQENRDQEVSS